MLFQFLKYVNPTNYFNLLKEDGATVFPVWDTLPKEIQESIDLDTGYASSLASQLDGSWQVIKKGYIGSVKTVTFQAAIPLVDEYRFIRKYFHPFWVYYILIIRLLRFNNPWKEIGAILNTRKVKRFDLYKKPIINLEYQKFKSPLLETQPKVSVIIPTLNRYDYLKDVLQDLEKQDYDNFEVRIIDQSEPFQESFYKQFKLDLKVIFQQEKALWLARNTAIQLSDANYFLLFDDDSRIGSNWIHEHIKCIDFYQADISSGTSISVVGAKVPKSYSYFKVSDQIDTGNVLIQRKVFEEIGLFDRQFEKQRMGDGEFGMRAYLKGFLNISNPFAQRLHLKVESGGLRELGSWDGMRPVNWFAPRPIPSVIYFYRSYYGKKLTRYALLKGVPPSLIPYRYKGNSTLLFSGYLFAIVLFPLVLFQVNKSWRMASRMLKEGPKIERI